MLPPSESLYAPWPAQIMQQRTGRYSDARGLDLSDSRPLVHRPLTVGPAHPSHRPLKELAGALPLLKLKEDPNNAMYLSSSSSSTTAAATYPFGEPGLDRPEFGSAVAPHGLITDASGSFFHFPSSIPPYSSSLPTEHYLHRSSSARSLPLRRHILDPLNQLQPPFSSSPTSSFCDYLDFHAAPMRRVVSTGDLQGVDGVHENYSHEGGFAGRVGRYSAEERKERIERYKSKRNQRNFHKKITYACRKTLADSRPRVRGRFARNGETGTEAEVETATAATNIFDGYSYDNYEQNQGCSVGGDNDGEWWSRLQAALATDEEDEYSYDDDLLASFGDVFSMDILS